MGLLAKLTGGKAADTTPATGRTPRERDRRAKEIRAIDASTRRWLNAGGLPGKWGR